MRPSAQGAHIAPHTLHSLARAGACLQAASPLAHRSSPAGRLPPRTFLLRTVPSFLLFLLSALPGSAADVEFRLTDAKTAQPVVDAVVSLTPLDPVVASSTLAPSPAASTAAPTSAEITQRNEEFAPFVTAVRTGTAVRFPNRDTVQHHVYSLSKPKKFELPLYDPGKAESIVFDQPGVVTVGCNIHDWMLAYVVILDTPHFAATPATGLATLRDVPPGRYRAEVWHPRLAKPVTRDLSVAENPAEPLSFSLALKPDRRIRRQQEDASGSYR